MSRDTVIISWTFANWVTVFIMSVIGWSVYRAVSAFVNKRQNDEGA